MSNQGREKKRAGFFDIIKNLFWLLIFLQFAPIIFTNLKTMLEDVVTPKTHIGYLKVDGLISSSSFYLKNIKKFLESDHIKALLVKVNSPGGFPGTSQTIFSELKKFKTKKPIVAFIENVGTSGAYNVALAANHIIAAPSALVGSIGVWLQLPPNVKDLANDWKIKFRTIQSGKYKTSGSPFKPLTPAERAHLQMVSDDSYNQFVADVAQARGLSAKNHTVWADGKVFTGNQAFKLKLIDSIGSREDAVEKLKKEAMIEGEIKLVAPRRPSAFMRMFGGEDAGDHDASFSSVVASFITDVYSKITHSSPSGGI
jgi:protease-4